MKQNKQTLKTSKFELIKQKCLLLAAGFLSFFSRKFKKKEVANDEIGQPSFYPYAIMGTFIIVATIGGFLVWSGFATLESAAMATGQVVAESKNKSIQHLEGGIIEAILVKDGAKVTKGQVLIRLDVTKAQASLDILEKQYHSLSAERARLVAERDKKDTISWPEDLNNEDGVKEAQHNIFLTNKLTINGQLAIMEQQIKQLEQEIESYRAQLTSETKQLALINEEIEAVDYLYKRKLIELPRVLELKRKAAELIGNQGQYLGLIAKAQQKIGETQQRVITIQDNFLKEVLDNLKEVKDKLAEVKPKLHAMQDTVKRTKITAPTDGVIIGLNKFTEGGIISPSETVMQILPLHDKLIAEARVNPNDIELIQIGQTARVYLNALKQRNSPALLGSVTHVSADIYNDEKTNEYYYKVKVAIKEGELKKLQDVALYPGMQLRVMIITQKRTPFDYFITPIQDSFRYAFREN